MSALALDSRPYLAAIKAAVKAALGPNDAYEYGQVPGDKDNPNETERNKPLPSIFVVVSVERTFNGNVNMAGGAGTSGWRASVRAVGRTDAEARWAMFKVATALNEARLSVDGRLTTPLQFESDRAPEPDEGRFSGAALYTFNH